MIRAFVGAVVVVLLAACSSSTPTSAPAPSTSSTSTTVPETCYPSRPVQGVPPNLFEGRFFRLVLPKEYNGRTPVPLIVAFHGHGASKELLEVDTQLGTRGRERGFAVALVDGSGDPKTWKMFDFDGPDSDYDLVARLVDHLTKRLCIDEDRVFAAGHSAGSAFAGFLVCRKPYQFAGVAMVAANIPNLCPDDVRVASIAIHGAKDPVVLYDGGKGIGQEAAIPPFLDTLAKTAAKNGCDPEPKVTTPKPGVEVRTFVGCDEPVRGVTIVDGQHPWPGGVQVKILKPTPRGADYDATGAILDFFDEVD